MSDTAPAPIASAPSLPLRQRKLLQKWTIQVIVVVNLDCHSRNLALTALFVPNRDRRRLDGHRYRARTHWRDSSWYIVTLPLSSKHGTYKTVTARIMQAKVSKTF